ncbi:alcohol dehydrogenase [Sorangium cellulosum]|uniref:Alcohol dehydrogenase n=1 Tax=Sorangium cellulosum TaxID=56 RepID=A0A2L0ER30_SORCE|nr:zinc-binding dehydrogenase [Sorangium cellulosum]AUX41712.1 alcohol dehydrogenase [Sorangium cellulosum]
MKAVQIVSPGSVEQLRLVEVPTPKPGPGEVLVRVHAAGVNYMDLRQRSGAYPTPVAYPFVPGVEVAGVVEAVGPGVDDLPRGARVAGLRVSGGGYAEYTTLPAQGTARLPDGIGYAESTALLVQGLTAQGLVESAPEIQRGASVLITAAAGGVGALLIQLAKRAGAGKVIAAASSDDKLALARSLGADVGVNYAKAGWVDHVLEATGGRGAEVIFDAVGGELRAASMEGLASRGRIVIYGSASGSLGITDAEIGKLPAKNHSISGYSLYVPLAEEPAWIPSTLATLFKLALAGHLRTPVHPPFALEHAAEAHAAMGGRNTTGKVVLSVA